MASRTPVTLLVLVLGAGLVGCDGSRAPGPTAPSSGQPQPPPQPPRLTYLLSGVVSEVTPDGSRPLAGVTLQILTCRGESRPDGMTTQVTEADGAYRVTEVCAGSAYVWAGKEGYANRALPTSQCDGDCLEVRITGDTRFDLEFVRR